MSSILRTVLAAVVIAASTAAPVSAGINVPKSVAVAAVEGRFDAPARALWLRPAGLVDRLADLVIRTVGAVAVVVPADEHSPGSSEIVAL